MNSLINHLRHVARMNEPFEARIESVSYYEWHKARPQKYAVIHYIRKGVEFNYEKVDYGYWAWTLEHSPPGPTLSGDGDGFHLTENCIWRHTALTRFIAGFIYCLHDATLGEWRDDNLFITIVPPWRWLK